MTHQDYLIKVGNWLFVRRSWLPIFVYILALVALLYDSDEVFLLNSHWYAYLCIAVSFLGIVIRAFTIGFVPKNTSGRNTSEGQVADTVNSKGMYSVFRHPLYVGNFFMWLGLIMYVAIDWFILLAIILYFIYYEKIIMAEENYMRGKFGDKYETFCSNTNIVFPKFRWVSPELPFSFRNVIKREYYGLFYMVLSFVFIDAMKNWFVTKTLYVGEFWIIFGLVTLVVCAVIRLISKSTKWLTIEGR